MEENVNKPEVEGEVVELDVSLESGPKDAARLIKLDLSGSVKEVLEQIDALDPIDLPSVLETLVELANKVDQAGNHALHRAMREAAKIVAEEREKRQLLEGPVKGEA